MEEKQLYTIQEVAEELSVSGARVRQMIATGQAHPKQRIGNIWVFERDEIERLKTRLKKPGRPKKQ